MTAAAGSIIARLIVFAILVLSVAAYFRFEIITAGTAESTTVYRLDRLSGEVSLCARVSTFQLACDQAAYSQAVKR